MRTYPSALRLLVAAAVCAAPLSLTGCGTEKEPAVSEVKDLGGPWPMTQSCATLAYDFDKYAPLHAKLLGNFALDCKPGLGFEAPRAGAPLPTIDRGNSEAFRPVPAFPEGMTPADFAGECRNTALYAQTLFNHLTLIQKAWSDKACDRTAANNEKINIIDYPACRVGCIDGETSCTTCRYKGGPDTLGTLLGDPQGQITCQAPQDAQQAVLDWCKFVGKGECKVADVECNTASAGVGFTGTSGTTTEDRFTAEMSRSVSAYVSAEGDIPGVGKAEAKVAVTVGAQLKIGMSIRGRTMNPWVERYGRKEGSAAATVECDISESVFAATSADGKIEVGLKFLGNGVGAGVEVRADGRTTFANIGTSFWIPAAGLTAEQITGRCAVWTMNFLKTQIENTGLARAVERFASGEGESYAIDGGGVRIGYDDNDSAYTISQVHITFDSRNTAVKYDLTYDFWFDPMSEVYRINNGDVAPYKDDIVNGRLKGARLVEFLNKVVKPYTRGTWRIDFAWQ